MMRPGAGLLRRWRPWRGRPGVPFQLTRYFTVTSLVAFAVLGIALYFLERGEQQLFAQVQTEQGAYFATVQAQLLREQKDAGRAHLVAVHEAGHATLGRVFANALWDSHFAPLVARAQAVPVARCRGPAGDAASASEATAHQACTAGLRDEVMALPGFAALDAPVRALMHDTAVFKVKVYDLRGLTVYSSELRQVGEDKAGNAGWRSAAAGTIASELVHRNRFSAFEGEVENRDLIQSYLPVLARDGAVGGVFEIYSDVTPLLRQLDAAMVRMAETTTRNQAQVQQAARGNQAKMEDASARLLMVLAVLLAFTYVALLLLARNAQRIIDAEARAREQAALREQEWHRDKMATMSAMAANISHEVGNPLAIISGSAQEIAEWRTPEDLGPEMPALIMEQTARIAAMTRRITDFARAGRETPEFMDLNEQVRAICGFLSFDRRFGGTPIAQRLAPQLPACEVIPDHLTEALMGLLQAYEESCERCGGSGSRLVVTTCAEGSDVVLRIGCECERGARRCVMPQEGRLASARARVEGMGGRLACTPQGVEIRLAAVG